LYNIPITVKTNYTNDERTADSMYKGTMTDCCI